jgi:hypothetical protein
MPVIRRLSKLKSQTNKDKNAKNSMENVPSKYRKIFERAKEGLSRADAIHAKCLRCMGMLREEVRKCSDSDCPLFSFRPYSVSGNPKKRQIKKKSAKKYPCRVSKVIEIESPSEGRVRLKVEILPETEK